MDAVLVDPLAPEQLHSNFAHAATCAARDIKDFAQTWEDTRSKEALGRAKDSRTNNNENVRGWLVTEHDDWLDVNKESSSNEAIKEEAKTEIIARPAGSDVEIVDAALAQLRESHPGVTASLEADPRIIKA